jgi:hypothetical protein
MPRSNFLMRLPRKGPAREMATITMACSSFALLLDVLVPAADAGGINISCSGPRPSFLSFPTNTPVERELFILKVL